MTGKQKLELNWIGKNEPLQLEPRILIESNENSSGDKSSENKLIHGDNLLALKALEADYVGKVKCIYIDPPYNTGAAFEHYDDGLEHSLWLSLLRERIRILWRLIRTDGSLWISIDDREQPYLRVLMDELVGRDKFIANIVWQKRYSRENREAIGDAHEYILVYAKEPKLFKEKRNKLPLGAKQRSVYKNPNNDPKGPWRSVSLSAQGFRPNQMYEIVSPITGKRHLPPPGSCWKIVESRYKEELAAGKIYFGKDGNAKPARIQYLKDIEGMTPWTWWPHDDSGHTDEAKKEIQKIFGDDNTFDTPKPERLIHKILTIATNEGDLVLDSFAGSGTTGAVAHKMGRKWIMIELGQHCYSHCLPRMKAVVSGKSLGAATELTNWTGGGGFRFYELAPSLLKKDFRGNWIISENYDATMLAQAVCKHEGFTFCPDEQLYWKQGFSTEKDFIFVTTQFLSTEHLDRIQEQMKEDETLLVCAKSYRLNSKKYSKISLKKIPQMLLGRCEFGRDDYSLNITHTQPELDFQ